MNIPIPTILPLDTHPLFRTLPNRKITLPSPQMTLRKRNIPEYFPQEPLIPQLFPMSPITPNQPIHRAQLAVLYEYTLIATVLAVEVVPVDMDDVRVQLELQHSPDFALCVPVLDDSRINALFDVSLLCGAFFDELNAHVAPAF